MAKQQWDGRQWWQWDGAQWQPADPQPPAPPPDNHPDTATGPSPATTGHRSSRSGWIVGGIVVLLFAAGGLAYALTRGHGAPAANPRTLTGTFTNSKALGTVGGSAASDAAHLSDLVNGKTFDCADGGEYPVRYKAGDTIVVADPSGTIIGTGHLEGGTQDLKGCPFTYTVTIPEATSYQVRLGGLNPYVISAADLSKNGWKLDLTV